ncbi:MAG: hypothetical protein EA360_05795 [Balneolaceae bacterium]|nr:MAG: hypothetical protein EA360_05795 [Balneolaceae bacterium]
MDQYTQLSKVKICKDLTVTGEEWPEKSFLELDSAEGSAAEVLDSESEPEELGIRGEHSSIPVYRTVNVELLNRVTPELIILLAAF